MCRQNIYFSLKYTHLWVCVYPILSYSLLLHTNTAMRLLLTALTTCLLFIACKKDSAEEEVTPTAPPIQETLKLTLSAPEASPYQFIKIQLPTASKPEMVTNNSVQINIGSTTAQAYIDSLTLGSNVYAFYLLVPEVPIGEHKITMKLAGGKVAEANIKINTFNKIADVSLYIKEWQENALKEIVDEGKAFDAKVLAGDLRKSTADSIKIFIQQAYDKNKALVDALPESEKREYVQLLDANKIWLTEYKQVIQQNPLSNYRQNIVDDCEELRQQQNTADLLGEYDNARNFHIKAKQCEAQRTEVVLIATDEVTAKTSLAHQAAKAAYSATPGKLSGSIVYVSTFFSSIASQIFQSSIGAKSIEEAFGIEKEGETKQGQRIAAQTFIQDREYEYSMGINLVNVNRQDAGQIAGFTEIIKSIDNININLTELLQFLPPLPTLAVPAQKKEKSFVSGFTISEISDPRITVTLKEGGKGKLIKFGLASSTSIADINFTFKVSYSSRYGSASTVIDAVLKPVKYKLGLLDGSTVPNSEIAFNNGTPNFYILLTEDGKAATGIDYNKITTSGSINPNVKVEVTPLPGVNGSFALFLSTTQTTKQTTSFDVLYNAQKVQTMTASVNDSMEIYKTSMVGNWIIENYAGGIKFVTQDITLGADGILYVHKNSGTDGTVVVFSPAKAQESWTIVKDNLGYHLQVGGARSYYPYVLKYPVTYILAETGSPGSYYEYFKQ